MLTILFWVAMLIWLLAEIYGAWPRSSESRSLSFLSTGILAWLAVLFLGLATIGFK